MAYIKQIYDRNWVEYSSYYIKERAIPHLDDGLKPVQRRILHTLYELDDERFHKVANVVGSTMKYHPHGDASIYSALVVLANKDLACRTIARIARYIVLYVDSGHGRSRVGTGPGRVRGH